MPRHDPNKTCFVIAPIGEEGTETRARLENLSRYVITPAAEAVDLRVALPHRLRDQNMITNRIVRMICEARVLVADLTDQNANVFYELALRHALGLPCITLVGESDLRSLPFDVTNVDTLGYDLSDPSRVETCRNDLADRLRDALDVECEISNPIFSVLSQLSLQVSGDPDQVGLGDVLDAVDELRDDVGDVLAEIEYIQSRLDDAG